MPLAYHDLARRARSARPTLAGLLLLVAVPPACAIAPEDEPPAAPIPAAFSAGGGDAQAPERWWTAFEDAALDRLVADALASNLDLDAAWQRLQQARAIARRERAPLRPEVDAAADAYVRRPDSGDGEALTVGLGAGYELDLWGRLDALADAEHLRAAASHAEYRAVALTLTAEVALAWFRLVEARGQRDLLLEQTATNQQVLDLIQSRFGIGQVRRTDLLRQRQLVEATREERLAAEARVALERHLLAVLLGRAPEADLGPLEGALPQPPPLPATGVPADLVRRRPDLQEAHALLAAADRELAAAISDRYPRLTLTASLSTSDAGADTLFDDWLRVLAAGAVAPLYDGGRRAAEIERARAARRELLAFYGQRTLVAFRQVEDALVQERIQAERIASLAVQIDLAERFSEQLRSEYLNGVGTYIDVLTSLTDLQELRRDALAARLTLLEHRVALYLALAGGFETPLEAEA